MENTNIPIFDFYEISLKNSIKVPFFNIEYFKSYYNGFQNKYQDINTNVDTIIADYKTRYNTTYNNSKEYVSKIFNTSHSLNEVKKDNTINNEEKNVKIVGIYLGNMVTNILFDGINFYKNMKEKLISYVPK